MSIVVDYVSGIISNSVAGAVDAATRTAGGYAGDILGKAGDLVERTGQGLGNGVTKRFDGWGNTVKGYGGTPTPSLARTKTIANATSSSASSRPKALTRSNSTPAGTSTTGTVKKAGASTSTSRVGTNSKTAAKKTESKAGAASKEKGQGQGQAYKPPAEGVKYTPGVLTGMPKKGPASTKPKDGNNNKNKSKKPEGDKKAGGEVKYTPGVVTGMPKTPGPRGPPQGGSQKPEKPSSGFQKKDENKDQPNVKYTPGVLTGMPKTATPKAAAAKKPDVKTSNPASSVKAS